MKYISTFIKTSIFIAIVGCLLYFSVVAVNFYAKYNAKEAFMSDYLISDQKINTVDNVSFNYKPLKLKINTDDGVYYITSNDYFKTINSVKSVYGEDFKVRKKVMEFLKEKEINNVKRGSLTYISSTEYEAYDFKTQHTYIVTYDKDKKSFSIKYKEI